MGLKPGNVSFIISCKFTDIITFLLAPLPPLLKMQDRGGCLSSTTPYPLPRSKHETEGVVSSPYLHPRLKHETERVVSLPPPPYSLPRSKCQMKGVVSPPTPYYSLSHSKRETEEGLFSSITYLPSLETRDGRPSVLHNHLSFPSLLQTRGVPPLPPPLPFSKYKMKGFHHCHHPSLAPSTKWRGSITTNLPSLQMQDRRVPPPPPPPLPHFKRKMEGFHHHQPLLASNARWRVSPSTTLIFLQLVYACPCLLNITNFALFFQHWGKSLTLSILWLCFKAMHHLNQASAIVVNMSLSIPVENRK